MHDRISRWKPLLLIAAIIMGAAASAPWLVGTMQVARADDEETAAAVKEAEEARAQLEEMPRHDELSKLFRTVAKAVKPAVVEVRVTKKVRMGPPTQLPGRGGEMDEFYRRFFEDLPPEMRRRFEERRRSPFFEQHGLGSGVIVDAENGYVITNDHVVREASEVEIVLADKRTFEAEWVRRDPLTDVAIVKIEPDRLVAAPLGDSDATEVGDWVIAIGAPRGFPQTVTAGIISAKGRRTSNTEMYQNYLQTDASINRGNSGGPLVNMHGEVIGINNSIVTASGGFEGIGFAIPSNMTRDIMVQLVEEGEVTRGYLGVRIQNVDEKLAESFDLPGTSGALVAQVAEDSPAERAGIKVGDFIVRIGEEDVANVNELRNAVARIRPGEKTDFILYREGRERTVGVAVGKQPEDMAAAFGEPGTPSTASAEEYGLRVASLSEEMAERYGYDEPIDGVVITDVEEGSDAADQGLMPGMVITDVDGKDVDSPAAFRRITAEAKGGIRLRVRDEAGATRFVFITPVEE